MAILTLSNHLDSGVHRKNNNSPKTKVVPIDRYRGVVFVLGRPEPRRQPVPNPSQGLDPHTLDAA